MQHLGYLFAAFGLSWLAVAVYIYSVHRRQRAIELRLEKIAALLEQLPR